MKSLISVFLLTITNVIASNCIADNCARAVIGVHNGPTQVALAYSDCSSFLKQTSTPGLTQTVPTYAAVCTNVIRYSSACSCFGLSTTTLPSSTKIASTFSTSKSSSSSTKSSSISTKTSSSSFSSSVKTSSSISSKFTFSGSSLKTSSASPSKPISSLSSTQTRPNSSPITSKTSSSVSKSASLSSYPHSSSTTTQKSSVKSTSKTVTLSPSFNSLKSTSSSKFPSSLSPSLSSTSTSTKSLLSKSSSILSSVASSKSSSTASKTSSSSSKQTSMLTSSSRFTTSTVKSSSRSTTSTATSVSGTYHPVAPTSYAGCNLDPNNSTQTIELIDGNTGISFIDVNNIAVLAVNTVTNLTEYYFSAPAKGPSGVYDLKTGDGVFLALYEDGHVGFVPKSSNGQTFTLDNAGNSYITTLWSVTCNGTVSLGLVGGSEYKLAFADDGVTLYAFPASLVQTKRAIFQIIDFIIFIKNLLHVRTDLEIDDPRCSDPDLVAMDKYGTSPSHDGCGHPPFLFNDVPFVQCCNDHDDCFDDCSETYLHCNAVFADCTYNSATNAYPGGDLGSLVKKLGYQRLAALFAWIVESEVGRHVFDIATSNRCDCCLPDQESCSDGCSDPLTDPDNCGKCDNVCESGICQNGVCSDDSCDAAVCGDYIACNGNDDCQCYTTADGTGFCTGEQYCDGLSDCGSNDDCGAGAICAVGSCCGRNVCLPINCGNPANAALMALLHNGKGRGATSASRGR